MKTEAQKAAQAARAKARRAQAKLAAAPVTPTKADQAKAAAARMVKETMAKTKVATIKIDNGQQTIAIGESICFKDDIEQSGRLTGISGNNVIITTIDDVTGEKYELTMQASRCWKE